MICLGSSVVEHGSEKPGVVSPILTPGTITFQIGYYRFENDLSGATGR